MSELMNTRMGYCHSLLVSVSVLALSCGAGVVPGHAADDADRPSVWIELGGQLQRMADQPEAFAPSFVANVTQPNLLSALTAQQAPQYSIGAEGRVKVQPHGSDWVFSASVLYGRSVAHNHGHQQTANAMVPQHVVISGFPPNFNKYGTNYPTLHVRFADGVSNLSENHTVLSFQAGKDVGIGLFGNFGTSVISGGIRIAQFISKADVTLRGEPDLQYPTKPISSLPALLAWRSATIHFHDYAGMLEDRRSFLGFGPSIGWDGSATLAGNSQRGIALDWGANAGILFGRQRVSGKHKTEVKTYDNYRWFPASVGAGYGNGPGLHRGHFGANGPLYSGDPAAQHSASAGISRSRSVVVPNLGGFAGLSFRYVNAKLSFGYRADFFFGAMDEGLDTRKLEGIGFHGPFATISVGLGG